MNSLSSPVGNFENKKPVRPRRDDAKLSGIVYRKLCMLETALLLLAWKHLLKCCVCSREINSPFIDGRLIYWWGGEAKIFCQQCFSKVKNTLPDPFIAVVEAE